MIGVKSGVTVSVLPAYLSCCGCTPLLQRRKEQETQMLAERVKEAEEQAQRLARKARKAEEAVHKAQQAAHKVQLKLCGGR